MRIVVEDLRQTKIELSQSFSDDELTAINKFCMAVKTINISLDEKLLKEVDKAAKAEYSSRSDYIRSRLVKDLRSSNDDSATVKAAKKILKEYKQNFKNLSNK